MVLKMILNSTFTISLSFFVIFHAAMIFSLHLRMLASQKRIHNVSCLQKKIQLLLTSFKPYMNFLFIDEHYHLMNLEKKEKPKVLCFQ
jgi:hypothetical protein